MSERIGKLVDARTAKDLTLSTFHSLGLSILKQEQAALGFPRGFTIYDSADQMGVLREILRNIRVDDRRYDVKAILHRISRAKNANVEPKELKAKDLAPQAPGPEADPDADEAAGGPGGLWSPGGEAERSPLEDEYDDITSIIYPRYQEALKAFAAVDFDDLLVETVRLLDRDPGVRERIASRWLYVLVDEYQDTNTIQLELVKRLCERHSNVTVVGDDDQSIYAWRGAQSSNILDFERSFPGARIVKLEQNYRSTPSILAAANSVIEKNSKRHGKVLWSAAATGDLPVSVVCADAEGEAKFVGDEIERLRQDEERPYSDFAVLYRSNLQARIFEEAFLSRRLPFAMQVGQKFYDLKEVKDVIAYLKVALNPKDEISLRRIVNYPARGIGMATVAHAAARAIAEKKPLFDALAAGEKPQIAPFVALIQKLRTELKLNPAAAVRQLVEDIALHDDLRAAAPSAAAAQRRIDNLKELLRSLDAQQVRNPGPEAMRNYLNFISLDSRDDDKDDGNKDEATLTTLHGAKGLEWKVVFMVGVEEELLPHARTLAPQGPDIAADSSAEPAIAEERRLTYVGITRARQRLYLTRALVRHKHGKNRPRTASRFLLEIPADKLEARDLAVEAKAPIGKAELAGFFARLADSGPTTGQ